MGNGNSESAAVIGTLPGTVCDQYGNELNKVATKNVSYLPNGTFNLFSLTQMILKGWVMGNNKTSIWIEKGGNKVAFDLMIPTSKGMMFECILLAMPKSLEQPLTKLLRKLLR
jgi:hypothetical protein